MIMDNQAQCFFKVHFFPVIVQSIFEIVDGGRIQHCIPGGAQRTAKVVRQFWYYHLATLISRSTEQSSGGSGGFGSRQNKFAKS